MYYKNTRIVNKDSRRMSIYGDRISALREKAGISQADLAFECGWRTSRLSNYETGYRVPKAADLEVVSNVLDEYLGKYTIIFIMTGKKITELTGDNSDNYEFTTEQAVDIFKKTISDAAELGYIKAKTNFSWNELVRIFSKSCGTVLKVASSEKKKA